MIETNQIPDIINLETYLVGFALKMKIYNENKL